MRKIVALASAIGFFTLTMPAYSQTGTASQGNAIGFAQMLNGVNPRNIPVSNVQGGLGGVPIDTTKAMQTLNSANAIRTPSQPKAFSFMNMFPKISLPSFPLKQASTPILPSSPFQSITPAASN